MGLSMKNGIEFIIYIYICIVSWDLPNEHGDLNEIKATNMVIFHGIQPTMSSFMGFNQHLVGFNQQT